MNLARHTKTKIILTLMLLSCSRSLFAAEPKADAVTPLGAYSRIKATNDHTYGHEMRLWQTGSRLMGQVLYWDGNPEAQKGAFADGAYNPKSGEIQFKLTITQRDVQPNIQTAASFSGRLVKNTLIGGLKWEGPAAQTRGKAGTETLSLPKSRDSPLERYANGDAWRKAVTD